MKYGSRQFDPDDIGERRQEVGQFDRRFLDAWSVDLVRPVQDERDAVATFVDIGFGSAEPGVAVVSEAGGISSAVGRTIGPYVLGFARFPGVPKATVIRGDNQQRVGQLPAPLEGVDDSLDEIIGLHHEIAIGPGLAFAAEGGTGGDGQVGASQRKVEEQRLVGVGLKVLVHGLDRSPLQRG